MFRFKAVISIGLEVTIGVRNKFKLTDTFLQ
jgi:hypothetical protein